MNATRPATCILSINVRVEDSVLDQRLASSPHVVGGELARLIHEYVQRQSLGYYPALEYFELIDELDAELLNAEEAIVWFVTHLVRDEVSRHLRVVFPIVEILAIQAIAHTMPTARPGMPNALHDLTRHFTANSVKLSVRVTGLIESALAEDIEQRIERQAHHCLEPHFDALEISSCDYLSEPT